MKLIKRIIRVFIKAPQKPDIKIVLNNAKIHERTYIKGATVSVRSNTDKVHLFVDEESVIQANFVFENPNGTIHVGSHTFIGGSNLICVNKIVIGSGVLISWGCTIMDNDAHSIDWQHRQKDVADWKKGLEEGKTGLYKDWTHVNSKPIEIKDKSWIGFNVIILKGVTIGEGAIIASGSVVTKDIPDWTIAAGNPAIVVKQIQK